MPWSCDMVVELPAPVGTADGAPASEEDDGVVPFDGAAAMGATATRWRLRCESLADFGSVGLYHPSAWEELRTSVKLFSSSCFLEKNSMPDIR